MSRKKLDFARMQEIRKSEGLNQMQFWGRYGITQSGGSRYEDGRTIPRPAAMLIWLHQSGKLSDQDLAAALKATVGIKRGASLA